MRKVLSYLSRLNVGKDAMESSNQVARFKISWKQQLPQSRRLSQACADKVDAKIPSEEICKSNLWDTTPTE
jgi:hypothetical protein